MTQEAFVFLNVVAGVLAYFLIGAVVGSFLAKAWDLKSPGTTHSSPEFITLAAAIFPIIIVGWLVVVILTYPFTWAVALGDWLAPKAKPDTPAKDNERGEPAIPLPPPPPPRHR